MIIKAVFVAFLLSLSAVVYGQAVVVGDTGHFPVSIWNEGTVPLNLYKVVAQKGIEFFVDSGPTLPFVLKPKDGKAIFTVLFIPQSPGLKDDKVIFYYDSAGVTFDSITALVVGHGIPLEVSEGFSTAKAHQPISILSASPNPAQDEVTIRYSIHQPMSITLELLDIEGRVVLPVTRSNYRDPGDHEMILNVSGLSTGVYIARVSGDGSVTSGRVIVSH